MWIYVRHAPLSVILMIHTPEWPSIDIRHRHEKNNTLEYVVSIGRNLESYCLAL